MTNEEAKDILREKIFPCLVGEWKEAIGIAINTLSAEKCTGKRTETHECDCISRQDAIEIIEYECGEWTGLARTITNEISALPSVQPGDKDMNVPCKENNE